MKRKVWHQLQFGFVVGFICLLLLGCTKREDFIITVNGKTYQTGMKEARAYISTLDADPGGAPRLTLQFPEPTRRGDIFGGFGSGLIIQLDPEHIESDDEFFTGIYREVGEKLIEAETETRPSSLDPDSPLDWKAEAATQEAGLSVPGSLPPVSIQLETASFRGQNPILYHSQADGGGMHIEFEEFEPKLGGKIQGIIVAATLIGHEYELHENSGNRKKVPFIMKLAKFKFSAIFENAPEIIHR